MNNWRERLCGSNMINGEEQQATSVADLVQYLKPNASMSNGGCYLPSVQNPANMQTTQVNFVLPTDHYSVLYFKKDGHAVIYSDTEAEGPETTEEEFELLS